MVVVLELSTGQVGNLPAVSVNRIELRSSACVTCRGRGLCVPIGWELPVWNEETVKTVAAVVAVVLSIISLVSARVQAAKAKRTQAISNLLGEKETVAFAALKLLRDGLPVNAKERALVIAAVLQACIFEGADRARALLYRVIELNREDHREELSAAMRLIEETFASMDRYEFEKDELDLARGKRRLSCVKRVVEGTVGSAAAPRS